MQVKTATERHLKVVVDTKQVPTIGIPFVNLENPEYIVPYIEFARQFGKVKILMWDEKASVDLLILIGGNDLSYELVNQNKLSCFQQKTNPHYSYFLRECLGWYLEKTKIFGICAGFQYLSVNLLNLNLEENVYGHVDKHHSVIDRNGEELGKVNSFHHQAITGESEYAVYFSHKKDKIEFVEAFNFNNKISGVQWHPEKILNTDTSFFKEVTNQRIGDPLAISLITSLL